MDYAGAGVDLDAADAAVAAIAGHVARTSRPEVLGGIGGFGGLFALDLAGRREPVLVSATDGVGTKVELGRRLDRLEGLGIDLVAMVVDDLVVPGAQPLFFLDYLAVGKLDPATVARIVSGIADGCVIAGCALIGGETAEHPGVMPADQFDIAGFGVGVVERDALLGPHRVRGGDALVALPSSGLHSNGYSLVRRAVAGLDLAGDHGLGTSLGEVLLTPTRIHAPDCLALLDAVEVHAFCHVTGGGLPGNVPRVLPEGLGATIDTTSWRRPAVVDLLQRLGDVAELELWRVFNMGVGMLAITPEPAAAVAALQARGVDAWACGTVRAGGGLALQSLQ